MNLADELKKIVKGDVAVDEETLAAHSRDASLFVVRPRVVVHPKDGEDVQSVVRFAAERKKDDPTLSITARSAGTDMTGGPLNESIILSFTKYCNRVKEVNAEEKYAVTEPGVYYRDFEKETLAHDLLFPCYPASRELCAMGGIVNNNSAGEKTLKYGQTKDYIRALRVVLSDGNEYHIAPLSGDALEQKLRQDDFEGSIYRRMHTLVTENHDRIQNAKPKTSKNSAGYLLWEAWDPETGVFDLTKVFAGAQGTLGIVTEAQVGLITPERESQMLLIFLDTMDALGDLVNTILGYGPTTFESYDDKTLKLAIKFAFAFIKRLGFKHIVSIGYNAIPEFFNILRHGMPALVLQVTFEGDDHDTLRAKAQDLQKTLQEKFSPRYTEVIKTQREEEEYWMIRRESFSLLRSRIKDKKTAPFIDDIIVTPDKLPEFLPKLYAILDEYKDHMTYTVAGHIGNGNFHIIPLMDLSNDEDRHVIPELADRVYALVIEYDGSITAEHNDGLIRSPYLKDMYGEEIYALFEETKRIFDPDNIFNPGKKVNADMAYAIEHIRRD